MLHRYGSIATHLARRLLAMQEGDRLDSIGKLAEEFGTGRGTIQSALKILLNKGALEIEGFGKRGSFIKTINRSILLQQAELPAIIGAMPITYSLLQQGLATGLTYVFQQAEIPLLLAQLRGAKNRLHFLRTGRCDFAVISKLTWGEIKPDGEFQLLLEFGPGSNVGDHVLLMANPEAKGILDGMKVGVDSSSIDHLRLTLAECEGKSVQFIEMSYGQSFEKLRSHEIDATIWDAGLKLPPTSLHIAPLSQQSKKTDTNTEACLVVRADSESLAPLIVQLIDPQTVVAIQRRVVAREMTPYF